MGFFDRLFGRQSVKVIGIILFFLILSSCASTPQSKDTIAPNDAEAYFYRGNAYSSKGEYDKAIADYTNVIELNPPRVADAYNNRGHTYNLKGEYDRAIADLTKAIEIDPNGATAYKNRGFAYYAKKEYDRAWEDVYKAQALGIKVDSVFLNVLRNASGRQR